MTAQYLQSGPTTNQQDWVIISSNRRELPTGTSQTKLLFNDGVPTSARNRATCVHKPGAIVIEKLLPLSEEQDIASSTRSSINFTALSEERLWAAVKLAKRDVRRKRLESLNKSPPRPSQASFLETSDVELLQELAAAPDKSKPKVSSPKVKVAQPRAKSSEHRLQKHHMSPKPRVGLSPPTRNPGPRQPKGQQVPLSQEIIKLQNELEIYIQKVEQLANTGKKTEETLEPDEQIKLEMRRQAQVARSTSHIYALQQQVKVIQEDIEKLRGQKMWNAKKSTAISRLAAAYRGALRALQVFTQQLSDLSYCNLPPHLKDLGQLIRQLSLCSAKVEVDQGSNIPESALDILQKLETLDSALSKHERLQKMQVEACPPHRRAPLGGTSPSTVPRGPTTAPPQSACKPANPKRAIHGKKMFPQKPRVPSHQHMNRREVLRAGIHRLAQQRELRHDVFHTNATCKKGGVLHTEKNKAGILMRRNQMQNANFHQPTVSSWLRVNHPPQKEHSVPWIPTSPHSPPPQRSPHQRTKPEPRCLFSPVKTPQSPQKHKDSDELRAEPVLSSPKRKQAQEEALREAWLEKMTMQRLKQLNQLSKEETDRIQRLRTEVLSPTQWAERAEQKAVERIQPLLDEAQQIGESRSRIIPSLKNRLSEQATQRVAESAEQLSEALLEDLLEDSVRVAWAAETDRQLEDADQRRLQAPTLESMLLRMEEIQRDEEEVRRRFASISYSDPLYWQQPATAGPQRSTPGTRPTSPQPIILTRPVVRPDPAVDIVLEKPVETGVLSENSLTEEGSPEDLQFRSNTVFPVPAVRSGGAVFSVPSHMLSSIRRNRQDYEAYLHAVDHNTVGGLDPWFIADSLAEELLSEALADVAAEFQDVVEDYAEAVFTSEFLQPVQSPPPSVQALSSR